MIFKRHSVENIRGMRVFVILLLLNGMTDFLYLLLVAPGWWRCRCYPVNTRVKSRACQLKYYIVFIICWLTLSNHFCRRYCYRAHSISAQYLTASCTHCTGGRVCASVAPEPEGRTWKYCTSIRIRFLIFISIYTHN